MGNANKIACEILYRPNELRFEESIRNFQGCPTLATTSKGRIYLGWYSGGTREPHMENYNVLIYSDDFGKSWSKPLLIIESSKKNFIHALDIQLWTDPKGHLHVVWVQNNTELEPKILPKGLKNQPLVCVDGYMFNDFVHAEWEMVCENPDDENPIFSEPRYLDKGFLRCKPLITSSGRYLAFNYDQTEEKYGYSVSDDQGKTYTHRYGPLKVSTMFDESMAYELKDGSIRMLARSDTGELAETYSYDDGESWTEAKLSGIDSPNTRFYIGRTPSGKILMVNSDHRTSRTNMTVYLSEDEGKTWKYKLLLDSRWDISYPDVDYYEDKIFITYDRERGGAKEILFVSLTEEDIIKGNKVEIKVVSKPMRQKVIEQVLDKKLIAILRGIPKDKLIPLADALYEGGIRLIEIPFSMNKKVSDQETANMIKSLVERYEGKMLVGSGTVLEVSQVELTKWAGGHYIISPDTCEEVITKTRELGMVSMPGALTPTEIRTALKYGADFIKIFPSGNFGPGYIKAVKAPLSTVKMLAVGGINENNLKDYLKVGVCGFGVGSNICPNELLEKEDYKAITELARKYVEALGE